MHTVMGHASAQTTMDVCDHLFELGGQDTALRLEGWLAPEQSCAASM
ncbi:MAG: hypothetical protein AB2L09_11880 [Coriobacteriia bacterium]